MKTIGMTLLVCGLPLISVAASPTSARSTSLAVAGDRAVSVTGHVGRGPVVHFSAASQTTGWLRGWPMIFHDPQRTNRSPATGPREPHLLFSRRHTDVYLVGSGGRLYGVTLAAQRVQAVALGPNGQRRVTYPLAVPLQTLLPDGKILAGGPDDAQIHAFTRDGRPSWAVGDVGLFKGAVPLATADNRFIAPFVGHPGATAGIDVITSAGRLAQRIEPGVSTWAVALAATGTIYAVIELPRPSDTAYSYWDTYLEALAPTGAGIWRVKLGSEQYSVVGCNCLMIGQSGDIYLGYANALYAYHSDGTVGWHRPIAGGVLSMAERPDGSIVIAAPDAVEALTPSGSILWQRHLPLQPANPGFSNVFGGDLITDAAGTTFVGGVNNSRGSITVLSSTGKRLAVLASGRAKYGILP